VDVALGLGYAIGVMCVGVIAWVANFLEKRENDDIMEVVQEVRGNKTATPKKTVRKPAVAKKVAVTKKVEQK
jgi:hypothetical protein